MNNNIILRDYQLEAVEKCINNNDNGLVISPTGSGKSLIIKKIAAHYKKSYVLIITPRRELVEQFKKHTLPYNVECHTINTAYYRKLSGDLLLIDEAHLVREFDGMCRSVMNRFTRYIGFTATPFRRMSGYLVPEIFPKLFFEIDRDYLIENGYLTQRKLESIDHDCMINVKNQSLDNMYKLSQETCVYTENTMTHFLEHNPDKEQAIIFTCDNTHSESVEQFLKMKGEQCAIISAKTPKIERRGLIEQFKQGHITYLINCNILTAGFDYPALKRVVILRPTTSYSLYEQMCGRGDRLYDGKECNSIWDYTINQFHFGRLTSKKSDKFCFSCGEQTDHRLKKCTHCDKTLIKGECPQKKCFNCEEMNHNAAVYCKYCRAFLKATVGCFKFTHYKVRIGFKKNRKILTFNFKTNNGMERIDFVLNYNRGFQLHQFLNNRGGEILFNKKNQLVKVWGYQKQGYFNVKR